jgi:hypothetical protein
MLASTVQFSNNDQPPTTPPRRASSLGPATEGQAHARTLRHPTACPTRPVDDPAFHAEAVLATHQTDRAE